VTSLRFEWDERKNASNVKKHGVSFEEAQTAFSDDQGLVIEDPDHSASEDRFVLLGMSSTLRLLVVCHCVRDDGDVIRLISARKAGVAERRAYSARW